MSERVKIMLLVVIVDSQKDETVCELLKKLDCRGIFSSHAMGTARSEMLTMLGLGQTEKSVIFSTIQADKERKIISKLNKKMHLSQPGNGIAFTTDINSVSGMKALAYLGGMPIVGG